jgi:periplasmic protein TonB
MVRHKNPTHDLRRTGRKRYRLSAVLTLILLATVTVLLPEYQTTMAAPRTDPVILQVEQIPETRQTRTKPLPRPAVPIETESQDVPDDETIESTELNFDAPIIAPLKRSIEDAELEEDVIEFHLAEEKPKVVDCPGPVYPEMARRAGISGRVFVQFIVGKDGRTSRVTAIKGPEILRQAAIESVRQCIFRPAMQNGSPVDVKMTLGIRFDLSR